MNEKEIITKYKAKEAEKRRKRMIELGRKGGLASKAKGTDYSALVGLRYKKKPVDK